MNDKLEQTAEALRRVGAGELPAVERDRTVPPVVDNLLAARATRANLEELGPEAYLQNAPTLIAEAQLDATIALAEATRVLAMVQSGTDLDRAARATMDRWAEAAP